MLSRSLTKYLMLSLLLVLATIGLFAYFYVDYYLYDSPEDIVLEIPKGASLGEIARRLEESGVIKNANAFKGYVLFRGWEKSLKAGEYEFQQGSLMGDVVGKLLRGDVVLREITIPEGLTVAQIAELLDSKGVIKRENFLKVARDPELARGVLGDSVDSFEGYLYPDTYRVSKAISAEELVERMVERHREVLAQIDQSNEELSEREIVILASIIEKETAVPAEKPLISAVLRNRLRRGMRLECDPTVIYGMGEEFDGNLRERDLQMDNPYNTYVIEGLPPGPISNPGRSSLEAAVNPAPVDYLYFVSRGDGTHKFSSSYREHLEAVRKYQRRRR